MKIHEAKKIRDRLQSEIVKVNWLYGVHSPEANKAIEKLEKHLKLEEELRQP